MRLLGTAAATGLITLGLLTSGSAHAAEPRAESRIVAGDPVTTTDEFPAMALLRIAMPTGSGRCGGSVIASQWVITAAHCVTLDDGSVVAPGNFGVRLGLLAAGSTPTHQVDLVIRHEDYDEDTTANDVALLRLTAPAGVTPIPMIEPSETALWAGGVPATVAGWGTTDPAGTTAATTLLKADVPMVADETCEQSWGKIDRNSMVCAGGGATDTCSGDSGGPLMVKRSGAFVLVGLTSFGGTLCATAGLPGVYTRLGDAFVGGWVRAKLTGTPVPVRPDPAKPFAPPPPAVLPPPVTPRPVVKPKPVSPFIAPAGDIKFGDLRGGKLSFSFRCVTRCAGSARLMVSERTKRKLKLRSTTLGTARLELTAAGTGALKVKLKRAVKKKLRKAPKMGFVTILKLRLEAPLGTSTQDMQVRVRK